MANEQSPTLAARIVLAMKSVGIVAKAGRNKDQGYAYQKAADIFEAAQAAFVEHGICLLADEHLIEWPTPLTTRVRADGSGGATMFICHATMAYTLEDVVSREQRSFHSTGVGFDTSDKALNKAKTMALKYFLKQLLLIGEDEDDADRDTPEDVEQPACPACGVAGSIIKSKFDPGWYCYPKLGGCGANFDTKPGQEDAPKTRKRRQKPAQSEATPETAVVASNGSAGGSGATGGESEDDADGKFDEDIANLIELCEATKWPGGMDRFLAMYKLERATDLDEKQRGELRRTLERRAKLIAEGKIQI